MVLKLRDRILAGPGGVERPLTRDEMYELAKSVHLDALECAEHRRFQKKCYARNTIELNEHFELVVICWLPGQESTIHDHGESNCLYLVVDGEMAEDRFDSAEGDDPQPRERCLYGRGDITIAAGPEIHRIVNPGTEKLVTIHIYSPPLGERVTHFNKLPVADTRDP